MFGNLKLMQKNQYLSKILATVLVITLTFANIILLGSYLAKGIISYGAGINDETNNQNVKFKAYFKQGNNQISQINSKTNKDLELYLNVSVKNGGYLENARIEFLNKNFEIKEKNNNNVIEINKIIQSGESIELLVPITIFDKTDFDIELLNMESQIKLTGKYKASETPINIESVKNVKIIWEAPSEIKAQLTQEIITNKTYNIAGENKKIIQVLLKSNISEGSFPIKQTNIQIEAPKFEEILPEEVIVASQNTFATNGKAANYLETESWGYNKDENIVSINLLNNPNEKNEITWLQYGQDEFIITYVYPETTEITDVYSKATNKITLYDNQEINEENIISENLENQFGEAITLKNINYSIPKGSMYVNQDTKYNLDCYLKIPYIGISDRINIESYNDYIDDVLSTETYFLKTYINKLEIEKILGKEGTIKIYNLDTEEEIIETNISRRR